MSEATDERTTRFHAYRVLRRRARDRLEIVLDFPRIGSRELEYLLEKHRTLGDDHVFEVDGEELAKAPVVEPQRVGGPGDRGPARFSERSRAGDAGTLTRFLDRAPASSRDEAEARVWGTYERLLVAAEESMQRTQRLTEMAVAQHEYMSEELRRLRGEYEQEFTAERTILRQLRAMWLEKVCANEVGVEDVVRFVADQLGMSDKTKQAGANRRDDAQPDSSEPSSETAT